MSPDPPDRRAKWANQQGRAADIDEHGRRFHNQTPQAARLFARLARIALWLRVLSPDGRARQPVHPDDSMLDRESAAKSYRTSAVEYLFVSQRWHPYAGNGEPVFIGAASSGILR